MTDEMVNTVIIYELADSGLTPEFFTNTTVLAFDATVDDFVEDIIDANPTKFLHYSTFSKKGGATFGVATLDGLRDS
tara:strand:+ start:486 stop:716 length:231 start_codon:yes stop_codon:yes gene_type:complete